MFEDLADLFEQAAADGTPIREIVGEDPVEFVEHGVMPGRLLLAACQRRRQDGDGPISERLAMVDAMNGSAIASSGLRTGPRRAHP
ncbi:hypothetical protein [Streptosporangium canum]|uniref:hypothetical protein n=1 Tax=Streptosporangium canum TaxID=324952 RepID=UPI0037926569